MNRIPTEGLKLDPAISLQIIREGLNEQNPDRGIETILSPGLAFKRLVLE